MNMRGAAMTPRALESRHASAFFVSLPTSRIVVMPVASQILSSYSIGCDTPARSSCKCACASINPGSTYLPVASISAVPGAAGARRPSPRFSATGSRATSCVIVFPSSTMSNGPLAGVPFPSTTMALRTIRRAGRVPLIAVVVCATTLSGRVADRRKARRTRTVGSGHGTAHKLVRATARRNYLATTGGTVVSRRFQSVLGRRPLPRTTHARRHATGFAPLINHECVAVVASLDVRIDNANQRSRPRHVLPRDELLNAVVTGLKLCLTLLDHRVGEPMMLEEGNGVADGVPKALQFRVHRWSSGRAVVMRPMPRVERVGRCVSRNSHAVA